MNDSTQVLINEVLSDLFQGTGEKAVSLLEAHAAADPSPHSLSLLRLATQQPGRPLMYYLRLNNVWKKIGQLPLKPNAVDRKVTLLCDYTSNGLQPLLELYSAAIGVKVQLAPSPFDSVEQIAIDQSSSLSIAEGQLVVLSLSEYWLSRYLGTDALVTQDAVDHVKDVIQNIFKGLLARSPSHILVSNFPGRAYAMPGGMVELDSMMGWNRALSQLNNWLAEIDDPSVVVVDLAEALFAAGGRPTLGHTSYYRSKMIFETAGTIATAREFSLAIGDVCGKTHRALVTDWDNTIWGGEVAEAGFHGVNCGLDNPDGLAYYHLQQYFKGLKSLGILLGGASRNDPKVTEIFAENPNLALKEEDFASIQVGFVPKSESIRRVSQDLGFGPEFMVFVDDSLFELTEVVCSHPYIDVVQAGPDAGATLMALSNTRFFNALSLSREDLARTQAAQKLKHQREFQSNFHSISDFLRAINIELEVSPLTDQNRQRVVQMFQKSNQFNLTTRRHTANDLQRMVEQGATIGVFSYQDAFGFQGVISVVVLLNDETQIRIESWIMSCRVLNRTVEKAVMSWILEQAQGNPIIGEFIPTEKNGLVSDLYKRFGFQQAARDAATKLEHWQFQGTESSDLEHFAELRKAA